MWNHLHITAGRHLYADIMKTPQRLGVEGGGRLLVTGVECFEMMVTTYKYGD